VGGVGAGGGQRQTPQPQGKQVICVWLYGYMVIWLYGCIVRGSYCYIAIWLYCYIVILLDGRGG
jgi:hypothetical protein